MDQLTTVVQNLDPEQKGNEDLKYLITQVQNDITNESKTQANIVALHEFLETDKDYVLSPDDKATLEEVMTVLSSDQVVGVLGGNSYEKAKADILAITPQQLRDEIERKFMRLENPEGSALEYRSKKLNEIGALLHSKITRDPTQQRDDEITQSDMDIIVTPNLCKVAEYYTITTKTCSPDSVSES